MKNKRNSMKNVPLARCLSFLLPLAASALPIVVDPATPLTGTYAVEWNTKNQFENWTTSQVTGAAVSGGVLSGTSSGIDPQVTRSNIASGPDLDLGFNDFIELRIQVPASYVDDIQIYYGTTATTGFSGARLIVIPNATIPKDGALHTYRINVGLEPWWRATLRDLRIDPGSVSGVAFAIDYLRVGDEPTPTLYQPRYTTKCPAAGGATPAEAYYGPGQAVLSMESKHFRFLWNNNVTTHASWTSTMAKGTLRNLEEAWQVYVKILGYREPCFSIGSTTGTAYKLNVTSYYSGYWSGLDDFGGTSLAQLNITPDGLQVDPPTWVIPHELMHCFQFHNTSGNVNGEWYETHANYGRERWLNHYQNVYPNRSNIEALGVRDGHLMMSSGRNYYLTWPFMYYVDTNPDALSDLYDGLIAKVWQETQADEFPMMALDRLTPTTSLKDIVGYYACRCATWDFSNQAAMSAELNTQDPTRNVRHLFTDLIQRADDPTWWRVPREKAPAQGAYAMHELIPTGTGDGRVVTVNLQGLEDAARGADWRASLVAVSDTGVERYTPLWSTGSSSITLAADENKLYLSVAGTPDIFHYGGHDESIYHFRSHASRSRFHYEVQVTGATPRERDNGSTAGLVVHSNGGGYKAPTASVAPTAYLGPNARVLGSATVSNTARIEDYAVVTDNAIVRNNAVVSGHAWVRGTAVIQDYARVRDWAIVDSGTVSGNARVLEHATVAANMQDTAVAKGSAIHQSGGVLSGNAIVDGDYMFNKSLSGGVTFGHQPFVGVPASFTTATPTGLYAAYNFRAAHDSRVLDQYGITDAFLVGSPVWSATDGERRGFLTFNGSSQSVALDRSVVDCGAFTFAAWVKPAGGSANQAVLWLGASTTRRMSLTTSDASGQTKFSIVNGGSEQTLATAALPIGVWSHVAVTLDGATGILYTNGVSAVSGAITIRPDALLAANTTTGGQHNYLARSEGSAIPMFQGSLDDAQFYTSALGAAQISPLAIPPPAVGDLLLSDSFTAESYDAASFNNNLATDQQGYLAPTTYTVVTGGQGWQAQHGNGATMLLVGDTGYNSRASLNDDFALLANDFDQPLAFQVDAWVDTGSDTCWASVVLGSGQNLNADSSAAKFAIRPVRDGSLQVWVNGSQMPQASRSGNTFRIVLSDTDGIGSAFNGNGSKAVLYNGTTRVGTYTLSQLVPGDGYLTVGAQPNNGYTLVRIDNLSISKIPSSSYIWGGGTGDWTDLNWRPGSVAGPTNSGLTGVVNAGTVTLGQATLGSFAANATLGEDATLVMNTDQNVSLPSAVVLSGEGALSKSGTGTLTLPGDNSTSGGTAINGGTLVAYRSTLGTGAVEINNGGTLYVNDQWVLCGVNHHGVAERNIGSLTIHAGGTLRFDAINGFANGAQNLYLNGGLVNGGPNNFRGDLYLFEGNEQITAGNATNSTIESVIGVTGNNNTITVETNSTLGITGLVKDSDWTSGGTTPGGFVKAGVGTLTLLGANSYSRLTDITAGTLVAANSTALGPGGHNGDTMTYIRDGATLALQGNISLDEHCHVWGAGVGGLGAVRSLGGNNALINSPGGGPGYALRSNTTVGVDADTLTISGFYNGDAGSYGLTKVGAGTLVLTAASTYTGGTSVEGGTLVVGAGGVAKGAVSLAPGATLATTTASSRGLAALYYDNAAVDQANIASLSALLAHFGPNSSSPTLVQTASTMNFGGDGSGFPAPYNSDALNFEAFYSGKLNIATPGTYTFNTSSDDGSMLFIDGQVVVANNAFQPVTAQAGSIALTAGMHDIVIAFNQGGGGYGMNAQMSGPDDTEMVDINIANASITPDLVVGSLAGEGSVSLTTGNLITGLDNSSTTFSGVISGLGAVTKFGTGVQTLAGSNTYAGATMVAGGTLQIDGDSSGVPGALTVAAGACLGGHGSYGGSITLKDGAGLNCDLTLTDSTLTCGGQLSFTNLNFANCTFTVDPGAGYRVYTLIEAASLGTVTFANADGTIAGVSSKLYISGNKLLLRVGHQGSMVTFF